ncbi:MAG: NUDIX domain-containing protein, partial [Mariprofundaceae bacterium]|nr:NUDIX domain-containing protein [Mariprofundaceae bacterium]
QVATVLPRYAAWFDSFPDIASLAATDSDAVLKAWEGLGYYRRARFIHAAAQQIAAHHAGVFPRDFDAMHALPGIGRSTAGAISSFCFGTSTPVLDGNVKRVLSRWHAIPEAKDKNLWKLAQTAIDASDEPDTWNQAMMELGATLCAPTRPRCELCPLREYCDSAFRVKPAREKKTAILVQDVHWQVHLHMDAEKGIWLMQRPVTGIWAGLWTPPISELSEAPNQSPSHVHLLTHRRLHLYAEVSDSAPHGNGQWVADINQLALPTGIHRMLAKHGGKL